MIHHKIAFWRCFDTDIVQPWWHVEHVVVCAAVVRPQLAVLIVELAKTDLSIAEINRRVGERAEALGFVRPSYSRVRQLVHVADTGISPPGWGEVLADVAMRYRPPDVLIDKAAGTWPMDERAGLRRRRRSS